MAGCGKHIHGGRYCGDVGGSFRCADCRVKAKASRPPPIPRDTTSISSKPLLSPEAAAALAKWQSLSDADRFVVITDLWVAERAHGKAGAYTLERLVRITIDLLNALAKSEP